MTTAQSGFVDLVVTQVAEATGRAPDAVSWRWIGRPAGKSDVADATLAVTMTGDGDDLVVLMSNAAFPHAVAEALAKIDAVVARLGPDTARRILRAKVTGTEETRSFAAFPRLATFSENRVMSRLEKRLSSRAITSWLADIARETRAPVSDADKARLFIDPLRCIAEDADMPETLRSRAKSALRDLPGGLFNLVEHNDFWIGNVLFQPRALPLVSPALGDFSVIDWRGARLDGYPFGDLVRFALSVRSPDARESGRELSRYAAALEIPRGDVATYVLSGIGRIGLNRGEFSKDRYVALATRMFRLLEAHDYA